MKNALQRRSVPVRRSILPGFSLSLAYTLVFLAVVVIVPLSGLLVRVGSMTVAELVNVILSERAKSALAVSFGCAFAAAAVNAVFGLLIAWVLVRCHFPGKRLFDAMIDLPLALPTAVAGIALTTLYSPTGWVGAPLKAAGVSVAFTPLGIVAALVFVGLPFVVRAVQPAIQELDRETEGAAASLGASRWQTFRLVLLPQIVPSLFAGFAMAFARGLGEYGSVIFIAGNIPKVSEIMPLLIVIKLEQYDYSAASALAIVMLALSFTLLLSIGLLERIIRFKAAPRTTA